jgi:putative oxidoreductase
MAPFVGVCEIFFGALILIGLLTRLATIPGSAPLGYLTEHYPIPLIIDMLVAISTTKFPILIKSGFWAMAHEARVDYAMLLGSIFLLIVGASTWSIDMRLASRASRTNV